MAKLPTQFQLSILQQIADKPLQPWPQGVPYNSKQSLLLAGWVKVQGSGIYDVPYRKYHRMTIEKRIQSHITITGDGEKALKHARRNNFARI